jgi:hypothetical protein
VRVGSVLLPVVVGSFSTYAAVQNVLLISDSVCGGWIVIVWLETAI